MSDNEASSYDDSPQEQQARWTMEFAAARAALKGWQATGDTIDQEFRNEAVSGEPFDTRLPLFSADVISMLAMLYGQVPKASVSRRFADSADDVGRVAGEILERILNTDIHRDSDTYAVALGCALMDFFLPGFANIQCRYVTGEIEAKEVAEETDPKTGRVLVEGYTQEKRPKEDVEIDYIHWKDWLWGPAKVVHKVPWWAIRSQMTRSGLVKRFGALGKMVPLSKRKDGSEDPWSRADVWEIYDRDSRKVFWFVEAFERVLDIKKDPLGLEGFFPFPEPLAANLTTSKVVPRPYYALHQDGYKQCNKLMSRIHELVEAVRVAGAYDKENVALGQILEPGNRNKLIPVVNWAKLAESGGIAGAVDWFPIEMVVQAIAVLQQQLTSEIDLLHQTTGFSDIMRGEATQAGATATEQRAKTRFGSVRIQRLQDQIAKFATDILRIKGEIVAKRFSPETIMERANVRFMPQADQQLAPQAVELLKSNFACYRIEVKPEAVALADFAQNKQERMEVLTTLTAYASAIQPIAAQMPGSLPFLLEVAKWAVSGVRASSQIEGVFDQMIETAKRAAANPQPAQPDPKMQAEQLKLQGIQMKAQSDMQKEQFKLQASLAEGQAEVQNDAQREENQRMSNVQEFAQRQSIAAAFRPPEQNNKPKGAP